MNRLNTAPIADRIEALLGEIGGQKGLFPVDIIIRGQQGNLVVEVFIDGDAPVDADTCAGISRTIGKELEGGLLAGRAWTLTVSSPGLDRPLKFPRQYPKHVGRPIALRISADGGEERVRGVLVGAGGESILVGPEGGTGDPREIPYAEIAEAKIVPRW